MTRSTLKEKQISVPIANADWLPLNEISAEKFKINKKPINVDVEDLSKLLKKKATEDDLIMNEEVEKDEGTLQKVVKQVRVKKQEAFVPKEASKQTAKEVEAPQEEQPQVVLQEENLPLNKNEQEVAMKSNTLIKFIAMGFAHLYIKKTTNVLKPLNFVAENFNKVFMALIHLGIPVGMTWLLMTKVGFIVSQISKESQPMYMIYGFVFYVACLFVWISAQVLGSGILAMFKNSLIEVAKVGKENE